jgi:hypothetical protein
MIAQEVINHDCRRAQNQGRIDRRTRPAAPAGGPGNEAQTAGDYFDFLYGPEYPTGTLRQAAASAQEMVTAVFDEVGRFCRGMPYQDDITLVVIKIGN